MTLSIILRPETEAQLLQQAAAVGEDVASFAARILDDAARRPVIDVMLAPLGRAFAQSGMTEDELSEFLEQEKHAMRADHRVARPSGNGR